jgi:hypothetical protein
MLLAACVALGYLLYNRIVDPKAMSNAAVPILGVLGLTQASLIVLARERLQHWSTLLWNRALTAVVFEVTNRADAAFEIRPRRVEQLARPAKAVVGRLRTAGAGG